MRIPKSVRLVLELSVAIGLFALAGFFLATAQVGWALAVGVLALPGARLFGILVIDSIDLWMRRAP